MEYTLAILKGKRDKLKGSYIDKNIYGYENGMNKIRELNEAINVLSNHYDISVVISESEANDSVCPQCKGEVTDKNYYNKCCSKECYIRRHT